MDAKIVQAREAALGLLGASRKEIEHGLELHAGSVVVDAYGFGPHFAPDGERLRSAAEQGATEAEILEMTEDMVITGRATDPSARAEFMEAWEAAGVTCIVQNAGEEGTVIARLLKRLAHFTYLTDMMGQHLLRAATPEDIVSAKERGKRCFYFSLNGLPMPMRFDCVEEELGYIKIFFQLGARLAHLTYNRRNLIGDGCAEASDGGLSDFGRRVVAEMNRVGMIVDVAHSAWRTSREAAEVSERPICASHTVCCALNEHPRGKPDEVIRAIAEKGGYVGICCIQEFLGGTGDIRALLDHVDYAAKTFGVEHVAIGTDVAYYARKHDEEIEKVPKRRTSRDSWRGLWPPGAFSRKAQWDDPQRVLSLAWTNWPAFTVGLVQRGYSDEEIRKIVGGNVLRVAREVIGG